MRPVFLVIGVPGSGKTWVCQRLDPEKFDYLARDDAPGDQLKELLVRAKQKTGKPLVTEVPFGESTLKAHLEDAKIAVLPVFIVENGEIIAERYQKREGRALDRGHLKRNEDFAEKAADWAAFWGTSATVLQYLSMLA